MISNAHFTSFNLSGGGGKVEAGEMCIRDHGGERGKSKTINRSTCGRLKMRGCAKSNEGTLQRFVVAQMEGKNGSTEEEQEGKEGRGKERRGKEGRGKERRGKEGRGKEGRTSTSSSTIETCRSMNHYKLVSTNKFPKIEA